MAIDPTNLAGTASLTFKAVFTVLSLWNGTSGTWSTDYWYDPLNGNGNTLTANGEQEWYINANDPATSAVKPWTVSKNILTLTAAPAAAEIQPLINGYQYTSGEINTFHSFSQTYGYFEMRAKLPSGKGLWPAFWLLPENGQWPPELDIMEVLGDDTTTLYTTVHTGDNGGNTGIGKAIKVADMSKGFHTYGCDWEAKYITWYFDGKPVFKVPTPKDMHQPMFMQANLAAGGYWPGNVDPSKLPAGMQIQYIAAYSALPSGKVLVAGSNTNLTGTAHHDTFYPGNGGVKMTGHGGADTFVFDVLPASQSAIADFDVANDKLDLSALFAASGYGGSNPVGDGYLTLAQNGSDTLVSFDPDGGGSKPAVALALLSGVTASSVNVAKNVVLTHKAGSILVAAGTPNQVLAGTAGNDTLYAGTSSASLTGGTGADRFVLDRLPTAAGQIVDFRPGVDKLDVSILLASLGYHGKNPVGDGYLQFSDAGDGSTNVGIDPDGPSGPKPTVQLTNLKQVAPTSINLGRDVVVIPRKGKTFTGNNTSGQVLKGTAGNDTFFSGQDSVVMSGNSGSNLFVFNGVPWNAGKITDFDVASDTIGVASLLNSIGYKGKTPFTDGILSIMPTNDGGTQLHFHPAGALSDILVTTLVGVRPSTLNLSANFVLK
ncbi:MAG: family 16 glycosylhydrolase [Alphaproteobacteria bacterium]|nr:family 16 glycosylhydrolase [Alphaproteobacteria bacterium]